MFNHLTTSPSPSLISQMISSWVSTVLSCSLPWGYRKTVTKIVLCPYPIFHHRATIIFNVL